MPEEKPVVYILHGDDPVEIAKFVDSLVAKIDETGMADMNLSRLDGRAVSESDLRTAAMALPFIADRRLVILDFAQTRLGKGSDERLRPFLDALPDTTALVLIVRDDFETGGSHKGWQVLNQKHWIWDWQTGAGSRVFYRACRQPSLEEMPAWIRKTAEAQGGRFSPGAAVALADHTGNQTQYATQEIAKLLTYVDRARPVEPEDVELLSAPGGQANVFDMVDGLAEGNSKRAMHLLHTLLEETDPISLFGMIVRQFRLLLQTRELLDEGGSIDTICRELAVPNFVARKLAGQAGRFSRQNLSQIYHHLLELDEGSKTGQWTPDLALDLFVAELKV